MFEVVHRQAVAQVGLGRIHPPGVDLASVAGIERLVNLPPEHLAPAFGIGVVEGLRVPQPVLDAGGLGVGIDEAGIAQFLVMGSVGIELRPHADHEAAVHRVHVVQHLLRVRIAGRVELVAAPLVGQPVLPVLDDIVHRNAPAAHLGKRFHQFVLGGIALAALPETEGPLRVERGLAGEGAVAAQHVVVAVSGYEVEVGLRLELGPETEPGLFLGTLRRGHLHADVGDVAVGFPDQFERLALASLEMDAVAVAVGVPGRTPEAGHQLLAADFRALEAGIILGEPVIPGCRSLQFPFVGHGSALVLEQREVGYLGLILVVDGGLVLLQEPAVGGHVFACKRAGMAVLVVELEDLPELAVRLGIAPAAERIGVEENPVAPGGHDEGYADLGVVLVEFLIEALVVEFAGLLLPEAVERLVRGGIEDRVHGPGFPAFRLDRGERHPASLAGSEQFPTFRIGEAHAAVGDPHRSLHVGGGDVHPAVRLRHFERDLSILPGNHHQAFPVGERCLRSGADADYLASYHLQTDLRGPALGGGFEFHGNGIPAHGKGLSAAGENEGRQQQGREPHGKGRQFHRACRLHCEYNCFSYLYSEKWESADSSTGNGGSSSPR